MGYTVVGIFDSKNEAREAMDELIHSGFVKENIDLSEGNHAGDSAATSTTTSDSDSVGGFFSNLFSDDEDQARSYTNVARDSEAILTVQADSQERANEVAAIFDRHGSIDVDNRSSQYQEGYSQTSGSAATIADRVTTENYSATDRATIPVMEEEVQVGKRQVETGGVRVRSRVIEKPVEEHLRLRQERVIVNRHPVNRAVTDADMTNFKQGDFEITERGEEAVVSKQARVVEEIEIGKQVEERDQVVSDTVRRTDVDVQEIDTDINARRAGN